MHNFKFFRTPVDGIGKFISFPKTAKNNTLPRVRLRLNTGDIRVYYQRDLVPYKGSK